MSASPRVGVLAVQGDVAEHERMLREVGAMPMRVRRASHLDDLDALVLPGGESTTIGQLVADYGLLEPLRHFVASGAPVWGTCAGMILLADRLDVDQPRIGGIDMTVCRNTFGRQVDSFETDLHVTGLTGARPYRAVFIRAPAATQVGDGVEVLAELSHGEIVAVRQANMLATAFHPELTDDARLHALFVNMV